MEPEDLEEIRPVAVELMKFFSRGGTLSMMMGLTGQEQEQLYEFAHRLYGQAKYGEAEQVFSLLTTANHMDRRFSLGAAACAHMQRHHADAAGYYGVAMMLDMSDPEPPIYMAENLLAMGDREKARHVLDHGLQQAQQHARHQAHVPRLKALLALLDAASGPPADSPTPSPVPSKEPT
jgi:type III secretion system low calcium response chaperone LcrH/SycD